MEALQTGTVIKAAFEDIKRSAAATGMSLEAATSGAWEKGQQAAMRYFAKVDEAKKKAQSAEGAIAAGVNFFAGYPITPSTEIAETMAKLLPQHGGKFVQMEDEIASMGAILGASLAGAKAMDATSGPGFSLKQELIGFAACAEIPCVLVDVQRVGPSTGQPTSPSQGDVMQARWGTHGDHPMIALSPWSVRETYDMTVEAVNLSERFRTPVILLMDEVVGHLREKVELPENVEVYPRRQPKCTRSASCCSRSAPLWRGCRSCRSPSTRSSSASCSTRLLLPNTELLCAML